MSDPNDDLRPKHYWRSLEELHDRGGTPPEPMVTPGDLDSGEASRRDFLALAGFSLAAASLAACSRAPIERTIAQLEGTDELVPGIASWYATTCDGCPASCSVLAKTRDGRPIKIEGNLRSQLFGGATCAVGQATVLSLYDDARLQGPLWQGKPASWRQIDDRIALSLQKAAASGKSVVLLSGTIASPSTREILSRWSDRQPAFRHVVYDAMSYSALRAAHEKCFQQPLLPHYRLDKAGVIVALDADFLGTWISPVEFTRQYHKRRTTDSTRSRHIQFESSYSVTGSNADLRIPVAPSDLGVVAIALLRRIADRSGEARVMSWPEPPVSSGLLDAIADELWQHRGECVVLSGAQDLATQIVVATLNSRLGNVGTTIDIEQPSLQGGGDDVAVTKLVDEMTRGEVGVLVLYGVNPGYDYPDAGRFLAGLKKVECSVSLSDRLDETSVHAHAICPDHHYLESWGDAEPVISHFSLLQPTIAPMFDTRAAAESFLQWMGRPFGHYDYVRDYWRREIHPRQREVENFDAFWERSLHDGVAVLPSGPTAPARPFQGDWLGAVREILDERRERIARADDRCELKLHSSVALRDGRHANNPWLQELPDPISKVTWGNVAAVAPSLATRLGLGEGDVVSLDTERGRVEIPLFIQPGHDPRTISIALGYGRAKVGKAGRDVGVNLYPLTSFVGGTRRYVSANVAITKNGRRAGLAATQRHFSMYGRPIIQETTLAALGVSESAELEEHPSLWPERPKGDHSWGMVIDLDSCTGCSACVIACQSENNVPVVGPSEVRRIREMHWIRIDRYYSGPEEAVESVHQPMMCQHCGNAPCETVCPVIATTHSSDGLNQQIYNRCVGTRYCANNCPYKVRRFNWFQYAQNREFDFNMNSPLGRMVLNPDVTVRSRGVMEKCSLCVQRIQAAKVSALQEKRSLADGDIKTACQQVCPAEAIVFGDLQDPNSRVSRQRRSERYYEVLDELGTRPNVGYLKRVRNPLLT